jgi:hypothetical protein
MLVGIVFVSTAAFDETNCTIPSRPRFVPEIVTIMGSSASFRPLVGPE